MTGSSDNNSELSSSSSSSSTSLPDQYPVEMLNQVKRRIDFEDCVIDDEGEERQQHVVHVLTLPPIVSFVAEIAQRQKRKLQQGTAAAADAGTTTTNKLNRRGRRYSYCLPLRAKKECKQPQVVVISSPKPSRSSTIANFVKRCTTRR
jgi:hypothetical protein